MSTLIDLKVPDIGDFSEVEVIEILVAVGDTIQAEQSVITVESDKASMEIPASEGGVVKSISVKVGDKVAMGSVLMAIESVASATSVATVSSAPAPASAVTEPNPEPVAPTPTASVPAVSTPVPTASLAAQPVDLSVPASAKPHASPAVRKFARELGVDLTKVTGSGEKARIVMDDIRQYVKQALQTGGATGSTDGAALGLLPWPKVDFTKFGDVEVKALSRIKKISGANLHRNWVMIPHVTNNDEADITDLEALRVQLNKEYDKQGVKFTMLAFIIKAVVAALKKFPEFNASLDGDSLVYKKYFHIGFAADTPNGLVVPVIRDADRKSLVEIAQETSELAKKARDGKLAPAEMQGGCFSISSLGGIGGTSFSPIINAPEVGILGVSRSAIKPVWDGQAFQPRLMVPLSLSYDHRVIDGALAARFNAYLAAVLADYRRIVL